jgi:hypothetical protein
LNNLLQFGIYYDIWSIFGNLVVIWYIFLRFGILYQEKSGSPDRDFEIFRSGMDFLIAKGR